MNRTDRLLAIVLELQRMGHQRAEDLAATFEISKRTVYRDMLALAEAGVPIVSMPGQGYSLVEGYFLPPLSFSADEAIMLLLGVDVMTQSFDREYRSAAEWAGRKIVGVLPESLREKVTWLKDSLHFITIETPDQHKEVERLQQLRRAIMHEQTVRFCYHARKSEGGTPIREADPYGLVNVGGTWILVAYCHLRQAVRNFRLARMDDLTVLSKTFQRPPDYMIRERERRANERGHIVRLLFDDTVARWVQEDRYFYIADRVKTAEGLLVTLSVRDEADCVQWILGWGRHVQVLEPESLRQRLADEARIMLENFTGSL
ncbi:MAG: YafY family transcriptional regulator [Anaerolineae bacterium]|nr:YafY family transcriptional regulator [Anaerolineae bacterium]